ncbi:30S ribosomal protein S9 [Lyticum sinuosum]|uniref:Small ribosomal subunit protein uS9 n=1 Tax=Lyticum sinuosum TaxID=1332059 RepID=A0AAE4VJR6_9RICK|nr:30S ribosomal protein S9 [Lyticum sinuosum]MDZ5761136.1 30S ribosomal protein S9 [Lyticum sinuosum]
MTKIEIPTVTHINNKIVAPINKYSRGVRNFKISEDLKPKVGRRKASIARVWLIPKSQINTKIEEGIKSDFIINDRDFLSFFPIGKKDKLQSALYMPFKIAGINSNDYVIVATVKGGGTTGQADAIILGIARNLAIISDGCHTMMRKNGYLTRDSRSVETKKSGKPKSRKSKQFSKR